MNKYCVLFIITALLLLSQTSGAWAIEFKAKGMWQFAYNVGDLNFIAKKNGRTADTADKFHARQRIRLQLDAVASESLSGTVYFEIGAQLYGHAGTGAALGADGTVVKLRQAYIDWAIPDTQFKVRMGMQNLNLPKKAGGGLVMDNTDIAAIMGSYKFTDTVGLTAFWARPFNDNYTGYQPSDTGGIPVNTNNANYQDNMDLFGTILPVRLDGMDITPWIMYGIRGNNTFTIDKNGKNVVLWKDGMPNYTLSSNPFTGYNLTGDTDKTYGNMFWAGLPVGITGFAPWNIEFDINYGYVESMGRYAIEVRDGHTEKASTKREGWLAQGLVEYVMDWGTPGIFGWYGSGDDGSLKNGSERMPSINPWSKFTSFLGGKNYYPSSYCDVSTNYAGSWGLGLRVRDVSIIDKVTHILRVAYWRGTNSTSMVKYADSRSAWSYGGGKAGMYLTSADSLVEFNLDTYWQVYDNLKIGLELGYVSNNIDHATWQSSERSYLGSSVSMQDIWRGTVYIGYTF